MNLSDRGARVILTVAWALAIAMVNPAGNFPINDDWSYADTVRRLVEDDEFRLNPWTSMPLGTQVVWGWLFSQVAGFSFTALRVSTLVLAWSATLGSYALLRLAGGNPSVALGGAAAVAFCPVFFPLAFTFMTDVPAFALGVWALVWVLRYADRPRAASLAAAVALLVATTLVRQTGIALGIGAMAALLAVSSSRRDRVAALALLIVPAAALLAYTSLVHSVSDSAVYTVREAQLRHVASNPRILVSLVAHSAAGAYLYLGLFMLPVIPLLAGDLRQKWPAMAAVSALAATAMYLAVYGVRMPAMGNILHDVGLNPILVARPDAWPHAHPLVWTVVTIAASVAASALALYQGVAWLAATWTGPYRAAAVLSGVACAAYLAPLVAVGGLFDRYLSVPFLLVLALLTSLGAFQRPSRTAGAASIVLVAAVAAFDVGATRDFFSFSRARWVAVHDALRTGIGSDDLEGGFEVTGWLANRPENRPDARLMISLGEMPGYTRVSSYEFSRWIGENPGVVYLLERNAEP